MMSFLSFLSILASWVLSLLLMPLLAMAGVLLLEVGMARRRTSHIDTERGRRPRIAVLIPAHDEEAGLPLTIASVREQLLPGDRLLVIADNCSDNTAAIARAGGAEVRERHDALRRGKGYALDFGIRCLATEPPEVLIVVDADCLLGTGAIDALSIDASSTQRPTQALYLMRAPPGSGPARKIAEFAFVVKNLVRPLGLHRLGLPVPLTGTGMAFPWTVLRTVSLASGHIVEDMQLGIDLARQGTPVRFCPQALVHSMFPGSADGVQGQRTRWEHGHLSVLLKEGPRLLLRGLRLRSLGVFALGLDLCVPPVALLAMLLLGMLACCAGFALAGGAIVPLVVAALAFLMFSIALVSAWWGFGRDIVPFRALMYAGFYMVSKIPVYLRFLGNRQSTWVRAKRDNES